MTGKIGHPIGRGSRMDQLKTLKVGDSLLIHRRDLMTAANLLNAARLQYSRSAKRLGLGVKYQTKGETVEIKRVK